MDVTCNRCGAEYEFEETLISDRGTTVKCTNCGHLFKVFHPRTPFDKSLETKPWLIRKTNGLIEPLQSLGELTRLITEGHYLEDDEISRTSQAWKRLGDIAELQSFFKISRRRSERPKSKSDAPAAEAKKSVSGTTSHRLPNGVQSSDAPTQPDIPPQSFAPKKDAKGTTQQPRQRADTINIWSSPPPLPSEENQNRAAIESKEPKLENHGRQRKAVRIVKSGVGSQAEETGTNGTEAMPQEKRDSDNPTMRFQAGAVSDSAEKSVTKGRRITPVTTSTPEKPKKDLATVTDTSLPSQPVEERSKGFVRRVARRRVTVLWIIFFTIIAGGVWITWSSRVLQAREPWVREAADVLARYRLSEFEKFTAKYARAQGNRPHHKSIEIGISRINAVWAQALRFKLFEQLFFKRSPNESETSNADYFESQVMLYSDRAKLHAEEAMQIDPSDPEAQTALSDALRLTGNLTTARLILDKVRSILRDPTGEFFRVSALLVIDESQGDYARGLELAKQAVEKNPGCLRTRFLLAYCSLAANETKDARVQVDKILKKDSEHPEALALASLIDLKKKQSAPKLESAPKEIAKNRAAPPRRDKVAVSKDEKPTKVDDPRLFTVYVELGEKALESGNVERAKKMFDSALEIRPDAPRIETGLGFVDLEKGRVSSAIRHFRNAARRRYPEAYIGLGEAYRQIGRNKEALSAYENYARLRPQGSAISIAKRQIDQLRERLSNATQTDTPAIGQSADTKVKSKP
jgi:predicted Zn finger-like uncharacterized protein